VVYDAPILLYFVKEKEKEGNTNFVVVGETFEPQDYGIGVRSDGDSDLIESLNMAILNFMVSTEYSVYHDKWFKVTVTKVQEEEVTISAGFLIVICCLSMSSIGIAIGVLFKLKKEGKLIELATRKREHKMRKIPEASSGDLASIGLRNMDILRRIIILIFRINSSDRFYNETPVSDEDMDELVKVVINHEDDFLRNLSTFDSSKDMITEGQSVPQTMLETIRASVHGVSASMTGPHVNITIADDQEKNKNDS